MHITFLLSQSLDSPSALGRHFPIAKELVKLGYQIRLIAAHPAFDTLEECHFWQDGVEVFYAGQMHVRKSGSRKTYMSQSDLLKVGLKTMWKMFRIASSMPTDAYQLCKAQPINGLATLLARFLKRKPLFLDCDDYETVINNYSASWQKYIVSGFERTLPRLARGISANTRFNVKRIISYGIPDERVLYIPNGIDRERFAGISAENLQSLRAELGLNGCQTILYAGSLSLLNHPIDLLLDAFALVLKHIKSVRLLIVGGGEDFDNVKAIAVKMGIADSIHFAGRVEPKRIPLYFKLADVSVEPVYDDLIAHARSPLKVFESMAAGTPVVAGDVGDRRDVIGEAGVLVPPGNKDMLAEGLLSVLQNQDMHKHMSMAALARSEQYYWDVLVHDYKKIYHL